MWIDDLDHLSGFTINGTNYSTIIQMTFSFLVKKRKEKRRISLRSGRERIERSHRQDRIPICRKICILSRCSFQLRSVTTEWVAEIKRPRSVDELIDFLKAERVRIKKEERLYEG